MSSDRKRIQRLSGIHLWLVLWKTFDAMRGFATGNIASLGLGLSDFAVLEVLLHKGPMPVNTVGSTLRLASGSRRARPADRRSHVVHLTPEGRKLITCAFTAHAAAMEEAASGLSLKERACAGHRPIEEVRKARTG